MSSRDDYGRARKELLRRHTDKKDLSKQEIEEWQQRWKDAGPVKFAEHLLTCPMDVPSHPDFNPNNNPILPCNDDCAIGKEHPKFRDNGIPYHLILSDEQKEFLIDLWKNNITMAILAAARGAGKTFIFGIFNCWKTTTEDHISITCMGGSSEQSELIQDYIDDWRMDVPMIGRIIYKSLKGIRRYARTLGKSLIKFPPCSTTAARGPHVNIVEIDEACVPPETEILAYRNKVGKVSELPIYPVFLPIRETSAVLDGKGDIGLVNRHTQRYYSGDLIKIVPYFNNIGVEVTPNHQIKTIVRKRNELYYWNGRYFPEPIDETLMRTPDWVEAKDLEINDVLVSPIPKRFIHDFEISDERLKLIGYYISEGSVGQHQIYYSNKSNDIINELSNCIVKEFGKTPSITQVTRCKNVYFTNREFREWLLDNCGHLAENKHIPYELMNLPDDKLDILLKAIMCGDGEDSLKKQVLHVKSEKLVQQFWFIYASRSILTTIEKDKYGYFVWRLWKKQKSKRCYGKIKDGYIYVPIRDFRSRHYEGIVCNLEVGSNPSYVVPYITLHNCEAESKSEDGAKAVAAVQWQLTGKRCSVLLLSSTVHYIFGKFYDYMKNPEKYGFQKVYRWSIAKHITGETDPYKVYTDKDPTHWIPNVWWLTKKEISDKRKSKSDEEWLCEALGGASMASGAVFKKGDLDVCICSLCENCEPYNWETCKLVKLGELGTQEDSTKYIIDRQSGFDYGYSDAPCSLTIIGRKKDVVFVLFNDEQLGMRDTEKPEWIDEICKQYKTYTFIPDPNAAGKHLNEPLEEKGYAVYIIAEQEKMERVHKAINFVERHKIIVPKAFWYLTASMRKLAWGKDGKIRKIDDHSFDSLCYSMDGFEVEESGESIFEEFLKFQTQSKTQIKEDDFFKGVEWK